MSKLVKVLGSQEKYDLDDPNVSKLVVCLSGKYYLKSDVNRVVRVRGKYYRRQSPLIVGTYDGQYELKSDAVLLENGSYARHNDSELIKLHNGDYTIKEMAANVSGKWYSIFDERIVDSPNGWILKSDSVLLAEDIYGRGVYSDKEFAVKVRRVVTDGLLRRIGNKKIGSESWVLKGDVVSVLTPDASGEDGDEKVISAAYNDIVGVNSRNGEPLFIQVINTSAITCEKDGEVVIGITMEGLNYDFNNKCIVLGRNRAINRNQMLNESKMITEYQSKYIMWSPARCEDFFQQLLPAASPGVFVYSEMKGYNEFIRQWDDVVKKWIYPLVQAEKERMNENLDDKEDENTATWVMEELPGRLGGGNIYHDYRNNVFSKTTTQTGGLGWTFGVEVEVAKGSWGKSMCKKHSVAIMGDGSCHAEYVTPVLHGDDGINYLKRLMPAIASSNFINNQCGVHVHVGGSNNSQGVNPPPKFTVEKLSAFLALGGKIEKELFSMLPKSRKNNHMCKKIGEFGKITKSNAPRYLYDYIFTGETVPHTESDKERVYSANLASQRLGRWTQGRYRWLNLVNAATDNSDHRSRGGGFSTVEFRLWAPTTSYYKIYNYIMISLAIFNYAINNTKDCIDKKRITLQDVLEFSFSHDENLMMSISKFIQMRKNEFSK